jgi:cell division transport system permease protein
MLSHAIAEGLKNLVRSFWLSTTAIMVITVSLGTVVLVASLSSITGYKLKELDNGVSISAYFVETVTEEDALKIKEELQADPNIARIQYTSAKDEEARIKAKDQKIGKTIDSLNKKSNRQIAQSSLSIFPKDADKYDEVVTILQTEDYKIFFSDFIYDKDFYENLTKFYKWLNIIGAGLIAIFSFISILVMVNILRITIYSYKTQIEIMRLVGATNSYIRSPFVAEGVFYNLIASMFVLSLFLVLIYVGSPYVNQYFNFDIMADKGLLTQLYLGVGSTLLAGVSVGAITSYMATQKYLNL